ncbi:hypothetical protein K438DRAFT_1961508 [Mycena galopus ATCC 62051]|nr:hypothetical protein K438DRAFT_1961508 [Mycena galopus ATCC 62051]
MLHVESTPASGDVANASTLQAIQDLLASPEFRSLGDSFDPASGLFEDSGAASPLFEDNSGSFDIDNYRTSPMETPYDDFATSPADDSPFSDCITTPVLSMAGDAKMLTGPLIDDGEYGDNMSLFGGLSTYSYEATADPAPKLPPTGQLYTISPSTPPLDSINPASTVLPPKPKSTTSLSLTPRRRAGARRERKLILPTLLRLRASLTTLYKKAVVMKYVAWREVTSKKEAVYQATTTVVFIAAILSVPKQFITNTLPMQHKYEELETVNGALVRDHTELHGLFVDLAADFKELTIEYDTVYKEYDRIVEEHEGLTVQHGKLTAKYHKLQRLYKRNM